MHGQLPLAIAQLLIKCIPALRSTSNNDATAMTPVLHPDTNTSLALGNQQDPIFILGHIARFASRSFLVPVLLFPPDAQLFERAQQWAPRWAAPRASVPSLRVGFRGVIPESCVRARGGGGGRTTRSWCSRHVSRRRRTDLGAARLAGRGPTPYVHHGKHAG